MQINWSDAAIKKLKKTGKYYFATTSRPNLLIRVSPAGKKTFVTRYTTNGKRRNFTIGEYPIISLADAGTMHDEIQNKVKLGVDPLEESKKVDKTPTIPSFAQTYLSTLEARNGTKKLSPLTLREYRRYFDKYILVKWPKSNLPDFTTMKITDITRADVMHLCTFIATKMPNKQQPGKKGSPATADRLLAVMSGMCQLAFDFGYLYANPCARLKKFAAGATRDRYLSEDEIRIFCKVTEDEATRNLRDAFMLGLHTAQRLSQVAGIRLDWIEDGWITFPAKVMKGKREHRLPLSPQVQKLIDNRIQDGLTTEYLFPSFSSRKENKLEHMHPQAIKRGLSRLMDKFKNAGIKESFSFHDFRRTLSTHLSAIKNSQGELLHSGIDVLILAHVQSGVTAIHYRRYRFDNEKMLALRDWSNMIDRINGKRPYTKENIVPFRQLA